MPEEMEHQGTASADTAAMETSGTEGQGAQESPNAQAAPAAPAAPGTQGKTLLSGVKPADAEAEAAPTADAAAAPQAYELKVPDQSTWTKEHIATFEEQARAADLSPEQAQKLLETAHANQRAHMEAHAAEVQRWGDAVRMDKEMGGAAFEPTLMQAHAAVQQFDNEGTVLGLLEETGYGSHPEVIRFLSRIGKALGNDTLVTGKEAASAASLEDRMYPDWKV